MNTVLLVTIVIGDDDYFNTYKNLFQKSQIDYANKHGYDYKVVTDFLDDSYKKQNISLYFQKALVCCQSWSMDYDYIIYVDNDVYININSPPIHSYYDFGTKVGVVDEWPQPSEKDKSIIMHYWDKQDKTIKDYYMSAMETTSENTTTANFIVNSGVLVFQPEIHKTKMEEYYAEYMPKAKRKKHLWFEQASLAIYLFDNDMYLLMDPKFNAIWNWTRSACEIHHLPENIEEFFHDNFFLHFAGRASYNQIPRLDRINKEIVEPFKLTCSLGTTPHVSSTLKLINYNHLYFPFDDICCSLSRVANCIQDNFHTDKWISEAPFLSLNIGQDKKHHFYKNSIENLKTLFLSQTNKKFFIMNCNNFNEHEIEKFIDQTKSIVNLLHKVTSNFQVVAYFHIVTDNDTYTENVYEKPNAVIKKLFTWTQSNNFRFDDIGDNIFFKNELLTEVYK